VRILVIAPQPFYQERGTPIATRLLVETLAAQGHAVDVLTYHVGDDPKLPGVRVFRTARLPFVRDVPIGFSARKLLCDVLIGWRLWRLHRRERYDVLHAVEEAVYLSLLVRALAPSRVVYDMDSSMPEQLTGKYGFLQGFDGLLRRMERVAIARSDLVIAVCDDLAARARSYGTLTPVGVVEDVSLVSDERAAGAVDDLRRGLPAGALLALYVGNLEPYQGVGLLLEAVARVASTVPLRLTVVGGNEAAIAASRAQAAVLGIGDRVTFAGPRPVAHLGAYLEQADILVSPRLTGHNTPMKLYSYLGAAKPVLATKIRSHTQVLTDECALLVEPTAAALAAGLEALAASPPLRERLGAAARELAAARFSLAHYRRSVANAYGRLAALH
jgi:glycosyltransferase involved in cell wall biosynthesis